MTDLAFLSLVTLALSSVSLSLYRLTSALALAILVTAGSSTTDMFVVSTMLALLFTNDRT